MFDSELNLLKSRLKGNFTYVRKGKIMNLKELEEKLKQENLLKINDWGMLLPKVKVETEYFIIESSSIIKII